jgi:biopolymer transport protein ExbD
MRFKSQQRRSQMPEINLVPMIDVMMSVIAFFVILSMTLTIQQQSVDISLPSTEEGGKQQVTPDPLIVSIDRQGQVFIGNQSLQISELKQPVQAYLQGNPKGTVVLKADKKLPYEDVVRLLGTLQDIGGDRVSLAIN